MLKLPPSASTAALALMMPLTVMKNAQNCEYSSKDQPVTRQIFYPLRCTRTVIQTVMMANMTMANVNIFLDPCGRLPMARRKHMTRRPR